MCVWGGGGGGGNKSVPERSCVVIPKHMEDKMVKLFLGRA